MSENAQKIPKLSPNFEIENLLDKIEGFLNKT
jgi:hypothetical protein